MLIAVSDQSLASSRVRLVTMLERQFSAFVVIREQLPFDTRFAACASGPVEPYGHLYLLLEGVLRIAGQAPEPAPLAIVLADDELERVDPARSITFRTEGPRVAAVQIRVPIEHLRRPVGAAHGVFALTSSITTAAARVIEEAGAPDARSIAALLDALAAEGVIAAGLASTIVHDEPQRFRRLWSAIGPLFADFAASRSLKEIASSLDVSLRQATRDASEATRTFRVPGVVFRDLGRVLRLRAAAVLLGAPGVTVSEVAERVGYGSSIAMDRAFRDARLPPPSHVSACLRRPTE